MMNWSVVMGNLCTQHDCGYSSACPSCYCIRVKEQMVLEEQISRTIKLIGSFSLTYRTSYDDTWMETGEGERTIPPPMEGEIGLNMYGD